MHVTWIVVRVRLFGKRQDAISAARRADWWTVLRGDGWRRRFAFATREEQTGDGNDDDEETANAQASGQGNDVGRRSG
jgi:hypothetical protein